MNNSNQQPVTNELTEIALQMLGTIEGMKLIIPEITDTIRKALEQSRPILQSTTEESLAVQPEPEGPTLDDIWELAEEMDAACLGQVALVRAALARWGRPTPQPVPVSERLPGPEDCDEEGRCWWWHPSHPEGGYLEGWMLRPRFWGVGHYDLDDRLTHTHWLPAHALPLPDTND